MKRKFERARAENAVMTSVLYVFGISALILLIILCGYIIIKGFISFEPEFLSFNRHGIGNQFFNTVYLVFLSLVISAPLGIAAGIYLAEYSKDNAVNRAIRICVETLSSLPSIVVGLFGSLVFIEYTHSHWNLMAGALAVSILNLPLIATTTEDAFKALPQAYKKGSMCLGATHWQTVYKVMLPACMPRIITGIILAAGRGFGEAAALLFTAGMSTDINWGQWNITSKLCPLNPFRPGETLSLYIWVLRSESINPKASEIADFSGAVLILLVLLFSVSARLLNHYLDKKSGMTK